MTTGRPRSTNPNSTARRGYGTQHQALRKRITRIVNAGQATCWRCMQPIQPWQKWDLGHADHPDARRLGWYAGPEHRSCNRATGTHRTQQRARQQAAALRIFD